MLQSLKTPALRSTTSGKLNLALRSAVPIRRLATLRENGERQMPDISRTRPTAQTFGEPATLTIQNGPIFKGKSFGARVNISGEAVFTTSLVGYVESLTGMWLWEFSEKMRLED